MDIVNQLVEFKTAIDRMIEVFKKDPKLNVLTSLERSVFKQVVYNFYPKETLRDIFKLIDKNQSDINTIDRIDFTDLVTCVEELVEQFKKEPTPENYNNLESLVFKKVIINLYGPMYNRYLCELVKDNL